MPNRLSQSVTDVIPTSYSRSVHHQFALRRQGAPVRVSVTLAVWRELGWPVGFRVFAGFAWAVRAPGPAKNIRDCLDMRGDKFVRERLGIEDVLSRCGGDERETARTDQSIEVVHILQPPADLVFLHNKIHIQETSLASTAGDYFYPTHHEITLSDGRNLAWREYGDPRGDPIFMFGSVLSTSHVPKQESDIIYSQGYRLLCIERPGRGKSSFDPMATPVSVAADILELCDKLEIASVSVLGSASGSPFAVAAAIALQSRAKVLGLISPRLYYNIASGMKQSLPARFYGAAARRPAAARYVLNIMKGRATKAITSRLIHRLYGDQQSDSDLLDKRPDLFDAMVLNAIESITQQPEGIIHELSLLQEGNQLDYQRLNCPVIAWRGEHDNHLPFDDLEEVTQSIPFADIRTFAGCGHLVFNGRTGEILEDLRTASNK